MEYLREWGPIAIAIVGALIAVLVVPWRLRAQFEGIVDERTGPKLQLINLQIDAHQKASREKHEAVLDRLDSIEDHIASDRADISSQIGRLTDQVISIGEIGASNHRDNTRRMDEILAAVVSIGGAEQYSARQRKRRIPGKSGEPA